MKKFLALLAARNKEFYRDRASLAWTFIFPFIVVTGFAFGYKGNSQSLFKVGWIQNNVGLTSGGSQVNETLKPLTNADYIELVEFKNLEQSVKKIQMHQLDFLVSTDASKVKYWVNPESAKGRLVEKLLVSGNPHPDLLQKQSVPGREIRYVEWLIPGIISMNMMFSSLFGVGYTIVRYRKNGVLKRLKATPVTAFQFLSAQLVSRLFLIMMTSVIVFFGSSLIVGFKMQGSYIALFSYIAVGASCMISVGLAFASRIASEELAEGLLNVLTWPMMFLSGIWFSLDGASRPIQILSTLFPLTHIVSGARQIMLEGIGLVELLPQIGILAVMCIFFLILGSLLFKWN